MLIRHGRVITATEDRVADIYVQGETITRVERSIDPGSLPPGTEMIDASGKYVFPGFIDPHVHIYLPVGGICARDDHGSASRAALAGGTTSVIEMICPAPTDDPLDAFGTWKSKAEASAAVDYSFHMSVMRFDAAARDQFREIVEREGIPSFKVFLAYKGAGAIGEADLFGALTLAKRLGVIVTAHCENAEVIDAMQRRLLAEGKTGPEWHEPSRPITVEADGVHHLVTMAELTGAHVYAVHTSCEPAVRAAVEARQRGVNVWIEAVVPHLVLDRTAAEREDFEGAKFIMSPPLRDKSHQGVLWAGLSDRTISTIATDHAPFDFKGQKDRGREAFAKIPNGIPSIQDRPSLVYTHGVRAGRIDLHTFVDACSTQAARIFGMYPRKGDIRVGSDADLVVWDPDSKGTISKRSSLSAVDYSAFEGWEVQGRASIVTVRGQVQAMEGAFVGTLGRGRLIPREPTHF